MTVTLPPLPAQPQPAGTTEPPPPGYVTGAAFREAGLSYRRLDYWTRVGYLKAAQDGHGSGYRRLWLREELGVAVAIVRLVDIAGLDLKRAVAIARGHRPVEGSWEVHVLAPGLRIVATAELWQVAA